MFLVVGLGNPGDLYKKTRHNAGFMAVDFISDRHNFLWAHKNKFNAEIATGIWEGHKVILCKPVTFMNLSGNAVLPLMTYYRLKPENIIVIHDDIDLEFGKLKCKIGGSSGGHNGLKSIDNTIGVNYYRLRVGVGGPNRAYQDTSTYVLGNFSNEEIQGLESKFETITTNLPLLFEFKLEKFKSQLNHL